MPSEPGSETEEGAERGVKAWPDGFAGGWANRAALLVLASLVGILPRHLRTTAWQRGSASACLAAVRAGHLGSEADRHMAGEIRPEEVEAALKRCGARVVIPGDEEYLSGLEHLADPPAALFVCGRSLGELPGRVAVVGARNCSPLGREVAEEIGSGLGAAGLTVVSGGARGIDGASHRGALHGGGTTIAVLGCGIDVAYPSNHAGLLQGIVRSGAVVSEYPPGVPARPFRFPARNRIIAAVSEAVVVVEGAAGSGSLITADHALDLGRPVYAVPGLVNSPLAQVPLSLIREGAGMIRNSADLLTDLGHLDPAVDSPVGTPLALTPPEQAVLEALAGPCLPEQVARALGLGLAQVLPILTELELRGLVRSSGGRVERRLVEDRRPVAGR
jgi:DNA processing protein